MLKEKANKTKGLWEGLNSAEEKVKENEININEDINKEVNINDSINKDKDVRGNNYEKLLQKKESADLVMKGLYLRKDQVKSLEKYAKITKKSYSEFVRDALDIVFEEIEKSQK